MSEHEGFPNERSEHDQAAEQHGDTWVAGSGSVVAPEGEPARAESAEGSTGWEHPADHAADPTETHGAEGRPWEAAPAAEDDAATGDRGTTEGGHGTTEDEFGAAEGDHGTAEGDHGTAEGGTLADHGTADDLGPGDYGTAEDHGTAAAEHGGRPATAGTEPTGTEPGGTTTAGSGTAGGSDTGAPPTPGTTGEQIEHLIDPAESDRFHATWREIQSGFVDDPRDAVHQASALAEEVLNALSMALKARVQAVEEGWQGGDQQADTERLRIALRGYRALLDQVLAG